MQILTWRDVLSSEKKLFYFQKILITIAKKRAAGIAIYPSQKNIFNTFRLTELNNIKVVILGQDPYSGSRQANGLAFSVQHGIRIPPSLFNIYKELKNDIPNFIIPQHGCLHDWAKQGVLLLNTILTVEAGKPYSHAGLGWEIFTDKIIKIVNSYCKWIVFLLWGACAQKKSNLIDSNRHYILKAAHPSPFSAYNGFLGCRHFSKTNQLLIKHGQTAINWKLSKY